MWQRTDMLLKCEIGITVTVISELDPAFMKVNMHVKNECATSRLPRVIIFRHLPKRQTLLKTLPSVILWLVLI